MPQEILDKSEKWLCMVTLNFRSHKYDLNLSSAFPEKPIACSLPGIIS